MKTGVKLGKAIALKDMVRSLYEDGLNNIEVADKVNKSGLIVDDYKWSDKKASEYKINVLGIRTNKKRVSKTKKEVSLIDVATDLMTSNLSNKTKEIMLKNIFTRGLE